MEHSRAVARDPRMFGVLLAALGCLGAVAILTATRLGPGAGSDSAVYVAGAESLAAGEGLRWNMGGSESRPSNHPPLYSAALVPFVLGGVGWEAGARLLGAGLFLATIVGAGFAARSITGYPVLGIFTALIIAATPDLIVAYSWAMTEGLYLALSVLLILLGIRYLRSPSWPTVVVIGLVSCLLYLTKYGGLSVAAAIAIVLLLAPGRSRSLRWKHVALYLGIVAAVFIFWGVVNTAAYGSVLRPLQLNSIEAAQVRSGLEALIAWALPQNRLPEFVNTVRTIYLLAFACALVVVALVVVLASWARVRRDEQAGEGIRGAWIIPAALAGCYLAAHVFAVLFTLPQPDTIMRTLLPIYLPLVLLACWGASLAWRAAGTAGRRVLAVLALVFILGRGVQSLSTVRDLRDRGDGYAAWKDEEIITVLRSLPGEIVYTDDEGPVFLLAGRYARSIPFKWGHDPDVMREPYPEELARMRENLETGALLVLFYPGPRMQELPPYDEVTEGLVELYSGPRGRIYAWPGSAVEEPRE